LTGMPMPQLLALSVGSFEIIAGLMMRLISAQDFPRSC